MKLGLNHPAFHGIIVFLLGCVVVGVWLTGIETNQEREKPPYNQTKTGGPDNPAEESPAGVSHLPTVDQQPNAQAGGGTREKKQNEPSNRLVDWLVSAVVKSSFTDWLMFVATVTLALIAGVQVITSRRQIRAYLGVANLEFLKKESGGYDFRQVKLSIKNGGATPAFGVRTIGNWTRRDFGEELRDDFGYEDVGAKPLKEEPLSASRIMLMPTEDKAYTFYPPQDHLQEARKGRCFLYFYGHIDYTDILKKKRSTTFCYVYLLDRPSQQAGFIAYRDHNESDPK